MWVWTLGSIDKRRAVPNFDEDGRLAFHEERQGGFPDVPFAITLGDMRLQYVPVAVKQIETIVNHVAHPAGARYESPIKWYTFSPKYVTKMT